MAARAERLESRDTMKWMMMGRRVVLRSSSARPKNTKTKAPEEPRTWDGTRESLELFNVSSRDIPVGKLLQDLLLISIP